MNKYIKLEGAIEKLNEWFCEPYTPTQLLSDLPTIEVSEDDLYIPLNNQTVERINRLHKDECGEYFDEEWLFNELEQISEFREVSEDCISREWVKGICEDMLDEEMLGHMLGYIGNAPSVVSTQTNAIQHTQSVESVETTTEQSSMVGEWIDTGSGQECSVCGEIQYGYDSMRNYCPNCGAKMKETDDEEMQTLIIEAPDSPQEFVFTRKIVTDGDNIKIGDWEYKGVKDEKRIEE